MKSLRMMVLGMLALGCASLFVFRFNHYPHPRSDHQAILLPDGRVLVIGGYYQKLVVFDFAHFYWSFYSLFYSLFHYTELPQNECEFWNPANGKWTTGGYIKAPSGIDSAALLEKSSVLASFVQREVVFNLYPPNVTFFRFDEKTVSWDSAQDLGNTPEYLMLSLRDGRVLLHRSQEYKVYPLEPDRPLEHCPVPGFYPIQLPDGRILAVSYDRAGILDLKTRKWSSMPRIPFFNYESSSLLVLQNGKVLFVGGYEKPKNLQGCAVLDLSTGKWTLAESPAVKTLSGFSLILLPNGKVLAFKTEQPPLCELYDPISGHWTVTDSLDSPRVGFSTTQLKDGRVFIFGGRVNGHTLSTGEIYDPATEKWTEVY